MKWCSDHWDRLRGAIKDRGLGHLIAPDGETAVAQLADELERGEHTATNYDPLMDAFWSINGNVARTVEQAGGNPLYLFGGGPPDDPTPEDAVDLPGGEGRTWSRCPLCYLGLAHELTCKEPRCKLPKVDGYAWMIDRAADDAVARARELDLLPAADAE